MSRTHDVTISAFDLDRLEAELAAVTKQRDRLAEALRCIAKGSHCLQCYGGDGIWIAEQTLAAMEGGSDE